MEDLQPFIKTCGCFLNILHTYTRTLYLCSIMAMMSQLSKTLQGQIEIKDSLRTFENGTLKNVLNIFENVLRCENKVVLKLYQ